VVVPLVATTIVDLAFGAWRVLAACAISVVCCLVYFVELRASSEVGQYISGEMLHDFIGWSSDARNVGRGLPDDGEHRQAVVLLATLCGLLSRPAAPPSELATLAARRCAAAGGASGPRGGGGRRRADRLRRAAAELAAQHERGDTGGDVADDGPRRPARRLPVAEPRRRPGGAATTDHTPRRSIATHALVGQEAGSDLIVMMMETGPAAAFEYTEAAPAGTASNVCGRMRSSRRDTTRRTRTAATRCSPCCPAPTRTAAGCCCRTSAARR
jgi:hypothetical protein